MRLWHWGVVAVGIAAAACASTIGPVVSSVQVLVVLDSMEDTLRIIPVDTPDVVHKIALGVGAFNRHALALRGQIAAVGLGATVISYDIGRQRRICDPIVLAHDNIASLAFADNGAVFAAVPATNTAQYFDPLTCAVGGGTVRGGPRGFVNARSMLFTITGGSPSWLTSNTAESNDNTPLSPADSISLSLPGNAQGAVLGSDGFIYVINAGNGQAQNARLSQVNPVARTELNVIPGFGTLPQFITTDGVDRIFVASAAEGLMVYNLRTNRVERDANAAIPLFGTPRGLVADDLGRVYALIAGPCAANLQGPGSVRVFGADLVYKRPIEVGRCPVAIGVTDIPFALYKFEN